MHEGLTGGTTSVFSQLTGTRAEGTLQIAEAAINEAMTRIGRGEHHPTVEVLSDNRLLVRYGLLHAHAELPSGIAPGASPRLTVSLASIVVAWGLKLALHEPFIHVHGRHVTIELADIPALRSWRELWRHVHQVTFHTVPGALRIQFDVAVTESRRSD